MHASNPARSRLLSAHVWLQVLQVLVPALIGQALPVVLQRQHLIAGCALPHGLLLSLHRTKSLLQLELIAGIVLEALQCSRIAGSTIETKRIAILLRALLRLIVVLLERLQGCCVVICGLCSAEPELVGKLAVAFIDASNLRVGSILLVVALEQIE